MNKERLPIGSVILLKNAKKKMMVIGYNINYNEKKYDYLGCLYPEGMGQSFARLVFNHEQIEEIFARGYEEKNIVEELSEEQDLIEVPKTIEVLNVENNEFVYDINNFQI